jgi:hypothetical protein
MTEQTEQQQEFKVDGKDIMDKIKQIIAEGNARRIIIKNEKGEPVMEIPLTAGVIGTLLVPTIAAIGAATALLTNCSIAVVKKNPGV